MRRTTDLPGGLAIRSLKAEDVAEVAEIENKAFTKPWRAETFDSMIDREGVELGKSGGLGGRRFIKKKKMVT